MEVTIILFKINYLSNTNVGLHNHLLTLPWVCINSRMCARRYRINDSTLSMVCVYGNNLGHDYGCRRWSYWGLRHNSNISSMKHKTKSPCYVHLWSMGLKFCVKVPFKISDKNLSPYTANMHFTICNFNELWYIGVMTSSVIVGQAT